MDLDFPAQLGQTPEMRLPWQLSHPCLIWRPFPSFSANLIYSQVRRINFPWLFSESFPHPSNLHAELLVHLTPTDGSSQKTQPNISQIFLISLAMINDTSKQEHAFPGSIDGFRQLEKSQTLNSHWMVWKMVKHKKCRVIHSTSGVEFSCSLQWAL